MNNLPPLRKKIYSESLKIVLIFGITSILINLITIFSAISITPSFNSNITIEDLKKFQDNTKFLKFFAVGESFLFSFISILGSFIIADRLSNKIAQPLKSITTILRAKPQLGQKIDFPNPTALELKSLTDEFSQLWNRLGEAEKGNIEKFKKQNQELETILSSVEDAVLVLDSLNKVTQINIRMCRILGIQETLAIDNVFDDLPTINENYIKMREFVQTQNSMGGHIFQSHSESGKIQYYSGRVKNVHSSQNTLLSKIILLHDITEIRLRNNLRTECTLELSQEMQRPLLEAYDLINKIEKTIPETPDFKRLEQIIASTSVIASRLEQISSLNDEGLSVNPQPHDLNIYLQLHVNSLLPLAQEKNIGLEYISQGGCLVNLDIEKFPWVIKNLVLTCLTNTLEGSNVKVSLKTVGHNAVVEIWDSGPEHTDDIIKYLQFDRLADMPRIQSSSNTGLWLTIARSITTELHGTLTYSYSPPSGNTFTVSLPALNS